MSEDKISYEYESARSTIIHKRGSIKLPRLAENIKYNPKYMTVDTQRELATEWDNVKKSKLIESFIVNFPVFPIILYEKEYEQYQVIDGRQRLKAIVDFYSNRLILSGLDIKHELDGCTYETLPTKIKTALNRHSVYYISIMPDDNATPEEIARLIEILQNRL
jgi:Protein of unknown function DUF262